MLVSCLGVSAILVFLVGNVTRVESAVALMAFGIFFLYLSATTYWAILQDTVAKIILVRLVDLYTQWQMLPEF